MSDGKKYAIKTVLDFANVPVERRDLCLKEFQLWLILAAMTNASGIFEKMETFVWIDDDEGNAQITIKNPADGSVIAERSFNMRGGNGA